MKRKRKTVILTLLIMLTVFFTLTGMMTYMKMRLKQITVSDVDFSKVEDGVYSGSYKLFPVEAEVKVTVKNHEITQIDLVKHTTGQGALAEVIPDKVVKAQNLKVDVVSGATQSSKAILKAIEAALNQTGQ